VTQRLPALLTVEEAGAVLRIGRTKAYAMAREWRDSGGRSGLPVIDLGHVLRVPRRALEDLIGAELDGPAAGRTEALPVAESATTATSYASRTPRTRGHPDQSSNQLNLLGTEPATD
jgi:hypothetical protein